MAEFLETIETSMQISAVVVGGIGTDITGLRLERLVGPGELELGGQLSIGAGGKSRNIAQMLSVLLGPSRVAMVGKTSQDPFQLWKVPVDALANAGVNIDFIKTLPFEVCGKYPQVALIAVDQRGNNQIYVIPGINDDFSPNDIKDALPVFQIARKNSGLVVLSLELPLPTAVATIKTANRLGLRVLLDPGGINASQNNNLLFDEPLFLLKPNEHETFILTSIAVSDMDSARRAAKEFHARGVLNVLITLGEKGAYLSTDELESPISIPALHLPPTHDETGCGDQTMATFCARLLNGDSLVECANRAILAGTLQFHKLGIVPITTSELETYL
jgi:ribokinase